MRALLPAAGSLAFGPALACLVVAPLVPVLAAIDIAKRKPRAVAAVARPEPAPKDRAAEATESPEQTPRPRPEPEVFPEAQEVEEPVPVGVPLMRPIERREAAGALASAAARRPTN